MLEEQFVCVYGKGRPCKSSLWYDPCPLHKVSQMVLLGCVLLFYYFSLFPSKKPNLLHQRMSLLQVWISQLRKLQGEELRQTSSIRRERGAQPNINTVKNIDIFFSDLLPLEPLRIKGQVQPWRKAICFGFCLEWIWRSACTVPAARQWVQEEGNCLHPETGTNQRLVHTQVTQHPKETTEKRHENHGSTSSSSQHSPWSPWFQQSNVRL